MMRITNPLDAEVIGIAEMSCGPWPAGDKPQPIPEFKSPKDELDWLERQGEMDQLYDAVLGVALYADNACTVTVDEIATGMLEELSPFRYRGMSADDRARSIGGELFEALHLYFCIRKIAGEMDGDEIKQRVLSALLAK